jgi:hypothetical protein
MRYLLMIYYDEATHPPDGSPEQEQLWREYNDFTGDVISRGAYRGADALHPTATSTTVRVRAGDALVTDGPFAETKEQLGGFYVIDCADLDEAIQIAAGCPGSRHGTVELRPIIERGVAAAEELRRGHDAPGAG